MFEPLGYTFFQNALIAGVLVSIISGIIGTLVVVNRMLFLAGGIAHAVYGGVGMAIFFGIPIALSTSLFAVSVALLIAFLSFNEKYHLDTYIGLIWAGGMALGVLLIDLSPGYQTDLMSYLFGSILAVTHEDIWFMGVLLCVVFLTTLFFYRDLLALSYDPEFARLRGVAVKSFYAVLLVLCSLAIVVAIRVVGLIMVIALLSIPTYIAERLASSLASMMLLSSLFALFFTVVGLYLSYMFDLTSGATIIMASAIGFGLFLILSRKW